MNLFKFTLQTRSVSNAAGTPKFLGINTKYTDVLKFVNSESYEPIPIYRVLSSPEVRLSDPNVKVPEASSKVHISHANLNLQMTKT